LFLDDGKSVFYSNDYAEKFQPMTFPMEYNKLSSDILDFHPFKPDWLLFTGSEGCPNCHTSVYVSTDNAKTWSKDPITTYAKKCLFAQDTKFKDIEEDAIYCSAYHQKNGPQDAWNGAASSPSGSVLMLYKFPKLGASTETPIKLAEYVVEFYVFENYMAVAVSNIIFLIVFVLIRMFRYKGVSVFHC
jgi:hypothetical protein